MRSLSAQALVIGSGAGGATTAYELSTNGYDVLLLEEGAEPPSRSSAADDPGSVETLSTLYRRRGMTPILGPVPIAYVEGCCVGGSTEINSGFWHRLPADIEGQWEKQFEIKEFTGAALNQHFQWAEKKLHVSLSGESFAESTAVIQRGATRLGWSAEEVPRIGQGVATREFSKATGQGMSRNLIPEAQAAGARLLANCRVARLLRKGKKVVAALAELRHEDGSVETIRIEAKYIFVTGGAAQTPSLLRRSGITYNVGDTFLIHPMLKVSALFKQEMNARDCVMPLMQVKDFRPDITIGGAYFSLGHLAVVLNENWSELKDRMADHANIATYYVGVRGTGRGSVRPSRLAKEPPCLKYDLNQRDIHNLSLGLARLGKLLLEAGAVEVYPAVSGLPVIKSSAEADQWLQRDLPGAQLGMSTVHAFSSCPMGENTARCAADSFGKLFNFENLYINDASMLPDSPGINPQGTIMAIARRNVLNFLERN